MEVRESRGQTARGRQFSPFPLRVPAAVPAELTLLMLWSSPLPHTPTLFLKLHHRFKVLGKESGLSEEAVGVSKQWVKSRSCQVPFLN